MNSVLSTTLLEQLAELQKTAYIVDSNDTSVENIEMCDCTGQCYGDCEGTCHFTNSSERD